MFKIEKISFLALICWFFTSCTWTEIVDTVTGGRLEGNQLKTLVIQPMGKFPESKSRWLADTLTRIYRGPVKLNEKIPLPKETYSTFRPRYRADLLLKYLGGRTSKGSVSIGLKHCSQQKCIMRDAKGKDILHQVNSFCEGCHLVMVNKGWELH